MCNNNVNACVRQASTMKGYSEFLVHKGRLTSSEMHLREVNGPLTLHHTFVGWRKVKSLF